MLWHWCSMVLASIWMLNMWMEGLILILPIVEFKSHVEKWDSLQYFSKPFWKFWRNVWLWFSWSCATPLRMTKPLNWFEESRKPDVKFIRADLQASLFQFRSCYRFFCKIVLRRRVPFRKRNQIESWWQMSFSRETNERKCSTCFRITISLSIVSLVGTEKKNTILGSRSLLLSFFRWDKKLLIILFHHVTLAFFKSHF